MPFRHSLPLFLLFFLALPTAVSAQVVEQEDHEKVTNSAKPKSTADSPDLAAVSKLIIQQTNAFRQEEKREPVKANAQLTATAQYFADYLARTDKFSHTADGKRPADRASEHGYAYCIIAENIAYEYDSRGFKTDELARKFVEGWKHSPGHRRNMLDPDVTETGVAAAYSSDSGSYYAVQMFGRPASQSIHFEVVNDTDTAVEYQVGSRSYPLPPHVTRTHEQCRPAELSFRLPSKGEEVPSAIRPSNGDRFVITAQAGALKISREKMSER
jgi:uncharacterized protein YkwD